MSDNFNFNWDLSFDANDNAFDFSWYTNGDAFDFSFSDNMPVTGQELDFTGLLPDADVDLQNPCIICKFCSSQSAFVCPVLTNLRSVHPYATDDSGSGSETACLESATNAFNSQDTALPQTSAYQCAVCSDRFNSVFSLDLHCSEQQHPGWACSIEACPRSFTAFQSRKTHESHTHAPGHYQVDSKGQLTCEECGITFKRQIQLQLHANETQHSPFACSCGAKFARPDVLNRHVASFAEDMPRFPCKFCKLHRGRHGFRRRDHLVQHLRGYHKFDSEEIEQACPSSRKTRLVKWPTCPRPGCESWRDDTFWTLPQSQQEEEKPFAKQSDLTKHMKEVHKETPFPCDVPECDKVGAKGYVREKDLIKHRAAKHPEAVEYVARGVPASRIECRVPGCGKSYSSTLALREHEMWKH